MPWLVVGGWWTGLLQQANTKVNGLRYLLRLAKDLPLRWRTASTCRFVGGVGRFHHSFPYAEAIRPGERLGLGQ